MNKKIDNNEVNFEILSDIEKKYSKKISKEELNEVINKLNLKEIISSNMAEFEGRTQPLAKKFAKFTKKMNGKDPQEQKEKVISFVEKNVYYFWKKYIENNISFLEESKDVLPKDIYYTYIFGFFVTLHSKALKRQEKINVMANALAELKINTDNVKRALEEYKKRIKEIEHEKK